MYLYDARVLKEDSDIIAFVPDLAPDVASELVLATFGLKVGVE